MKAFLDASEFSNQNTLKFCALVLLENTERRGYSKPLNKQGKRKNYSTGTRDSKKLITVHRHDMKL